MLKKSDERAEIPASTFEAPSNSLPAKHLLSYNFHIHYYIFYDSIENGVCVGLRHDADPVYST